MHIFESKKVNKDRSLGEGTLPCVAVSRGGRIFVSYFSPQSVCVVYSDDGGDSFLPLGVDIDAPSGECIESARVWIDGENRLWLLWSYLPSATARYRVLGDADAESVEPSEEKLTPLGTLLARPIECADGRTLFGSGVTLKEVQQRSGGDRKRGVYIGELGADGEMRICNKLFGSSSCFDSISLMERGGQILSHIRVSYGIERNVSLDGAATFKGPTDTGFGSYDSRFFISALPSGNTLFINRMHLSDSPEMHLAAMVSPNNKSYVGLIPLDVGDVCTPDACVYDGVIYAVWAKRDGDAISVRLASFTEQDMLDGDISRV